MGLCQPPNVCGIVQEGGPVLLDGPVELGGGVGVDAGTGRCGGVEDLLERAS